MYEQHKSILVTPLNKCAEFNSNEVQFSKKTLLAYVTFIPEKSSICSGPCVPTHNSNNKKMLVTDALYVS